MKIAGCGLATVLVVALPACGGGDDGPDIVGLYEVTSHEASGESCSGGTTPEDSPPYFRISEEELFGQTYYGRSDCTGMGESDCQTGGGIFIDPTDSGYTGEVTFSSGDEASCQLGYVFYEAIAAGDHLTLEEHTYSETGAFDPCEPETAEEMADSMPCVSYEVIEGDFIGE